MIIPKEIARNYISKAIWNYIEKDDVDYFEVEKYTTNKLLLYIPCWQGHSDLMREWSCIFEEAMIHRSSNMAVQDINMIISRYNSALEELKHLSETYCKSKGINKDALKNLFQRNQLENYSWVDTN